VAGRRIFVAGEILTAANVQSFLQDQAVMVFDDDTARGSAIPSPTEGMVTYLKDVNQVQAFDGSAFGPIGTILQVVSTNKTDIFSASVVTGGVAAITGLDVTITPTSNTSKILVQGFVTSSISQAFNAGTYITVFRGATALAIGDADGSRSRATTGGTHASVEFSQSNSGFTILDSPGTGSAVTYSLSIGHNGSSTRTVFVNRSVDDSNSAFTHRTASSITVMEVAA
jgi:hypothetical protein